MKDVTKTRIGNVTYRNDSERAILVSVTAIGRRMTPISGSHTPIISAGGELLFVFIVEPMSEYSIKGDIKEIKKWTEQEDKNEVLNKYIQRGMIYLR